MASKKYSSKFKNKYLILSLIFIAVLAFVGFIYFNQTNKDTVTKSASEDSEMQLAKFYGCSSYECLYKRESSNSFEGYTTLRGYYTAYETEVGYGSTEKITCDAFIPAYGNSMVIDEFEEKAKDGGIIRRNENGDLEINIDLIQQDPTTIQMIKSSNYEQLVDLKVILPTQIGREVPSCYSPVNIIKATDISD